MQNDKKRNWLALFLAAAVLGAAFTGCSKKEEKPSSAVSSQTGSSGAASSQTNISDSSYSAGLTAEGYFEGVTALSYVTLPDYKTMAVPEEISTVAPVDVESQLNGMLEKYGTIEQITDRAVESNDTVNIDYVGTIDGVEFQGGNTMGNGATVTIGVTNYIDDFLEQLVGHMPGETFDVNVTFPEDYGEENVNGKDAVFSTTINYIQVTKTPELTDAFVAENWKESDGWSTVAEAKQGVEEDLRVEAVSEYLWQEIQAQAKISEVPAAIQNFYTEYMKSYYAEQAAQYGVDLDTLLSQYLQVESMDELLEKNQSQLGANARGSLVLQALSEDMDVRPTDADLTEYFGESGYAEIEAHFGKPYLCLIVREALTKEILGK